MRATRNTMTDSCSGLGSNCELSQQFQDETSSTATSIWFCTAAASPQESTFLARRVSQFAVAGACKCNLSRVEAVIVCASKPRLANNLLSFQVLQLTVTLHVRRPAAQHSRSVGSRCYWLMAYNTTTSGHSTPQSQNYITAEKVHHCHYLSCYSSQKSSWEQGYRPKSSSDHAG